MICFEWMLDSPMIHCNVNTNVRFQRIFVENMPFKTKLLVSIGSELVQRMVKIYLENLKYSIGQTNACINIDIENCVRFTCILY